jgi:hypothetical protein
MQLKGYHQFVNERDITSLKHLFQGDYNQDPVLKKDVKKAQDIFMNDSFLGNFKHNDDDGFYVAYDDRAPKMDRVKQLMDKANKEMQKLELEIDKTAKENPQFYEDDDRLDQIMFFMVGKIKEKK